MKIAALQKLLEDADPEGHVIFRLGDDVAELNEAYATTTKDGIFFELIPPDRWERT